MTLFSLCRETRADSHIQTFIYVSFRRYGDGGGMKEMKKCPSEQHQTHNRKLEIDESERGSSSSS